MNSKSKNETNKLIRRNGFYRQKSYNSKELSTMLQNLNFNINLMPLNQKKTSKITSDESDISLSDDEAFGDFEEEYEENFVSTKKINSDKNFNQSLRKSASLSVLDMQLFCENSFEKQSFDNEFNNFNNSRNNSVRKTLPRTSFRSYSLNNYLNDDYFLKKENFDKFKFYSNLSLDKKKHMNTKKNIKNDLIIHNEKTLNSSYLNKVNQSQDNHIVKKQNDKFYFIHDFNDIEKDCFNQINNDFNQHNHNNKQKLIECGAASRKNQTAELKISGGAKLNINTNTAFSEDINKVNYTLTVSSCIHKPSVECSNEVSFKNSLNINSQTRVNETEYTALKNVCEQFVNQQNLSQKHFLSSESYGKKSFSYLANTNDSFLNQTNTNSFKKTPCFLYTEADSNQKNLNENLFYLNNSQNLAKNLISSNCVQKNSQQNFLIKSNENFNEKSDSNILIKQSNKPKLNNNSESKNSIISKSDLPIVFEETINYSTKADGNSKDQFDIENMQTLAETQFNQLTYHIAALSCVCENNKSLANNYAKSSTFTPLSTTTNPSSSVDSSPDSSQYSSPYNSPPSSPSSVSSYSSAEEDCSILSNVNNGLKLNINQSPLAALLTVDNSKENKFRVKESDNQINLDINNNDKVKEKMKISENRKNSIDDSKFDNNNQSFLKDSLSSNMNEATSNTIEIVKNDTLLDEQVVKKNTSSETSQNTNNSSNRVRKTSILRNQTPDLSSCNSSKKEVKFADTLGFALEKIKYFPPSSPQVKLKRHSVNLATMHRDYNQKHEFFTYHSRPFNQNNLVKQFEEKNNLTNLQSNQSKINSASQQRSYSPPNQFSNNFWANFYSNYNPFNLSRDEYCGDMFHQSFETNNLQPTGVTRKISTVSKLSINNSLNDKTKILANELIVSNKDENVEKNFKNNFTQINCFTTNNQIDFSSLRYSNALNNFANNQQVVSFLPLNFGQPYIQSDFPNRLRSQSVLLHSLNVVNNNVNGLVSVVNLTFEKKVFVKYTLNKWVTEKVCEARYSKKDCDNSDKFIFQITLQENDFPQFQLDEDRTMMFAIRYETGDGRTYWDNNYGQDYRLKCKFA